MTTHRRHNPTNWRADSPRRARLPREWHRTRARILRRDNRRCQWPDTSGATCGAPATDVDHRDRTAGDDDANLWALCRAHHRAKTTREGHEANRNKLQQKRAEKFARRHKHPGIIGDQFDAPRV